MLGTLHVSTQLPQNNPKAKVILFPSLDQRGRSNFTKVLQLVSG